MSEHRLEGRALSQSTAVARGDSRYSFTAQFLCSSAMFARRCAEIELVHPDCPDEATRTEHLGHVTAAIMRCAAAVEAESAELTMHGPGHHLGSNGVDIKARDLLAPCAESIDRLEPLERYKLILCLLRKPPMGEGGPPWQDMTALIKLRNVITHYTSSWGEEMESKALFKTLRNLRLPAPRFVSLNSNFFPHQLLGAACAGWSVHTAVAFINGF